MIVKKVALALKGLKGIKQWGHPMEITDAHANQII